MAKLYYGDENNTAVEINVGGDTSDCIKKDGTTTTTALIPFAEGIQTSKIDGGYGLSISSEAQLAETNISQGDGQNKVTLKIGMYTGNPVNGYIRATLNNGSNPITPVQNSDLTTKQYVDGQIKAVSANIHSIPDGGTAGQVLTAKGDGTCEWGDILVDVTPSSAQYYSIYQIVGSRFILFAIKETLNLVAGTKIVDEGKIPSPYLSNGSVIGSQYSTTGTFPREINAQVFIAPNGVVEYSGAGSLRKGFAFWYMTA